jgi:hypothetical protein
MIYKTRSEGKICIYNQIIPLKNISGLIFCSVIRPLVSFLEFFQIAGSGHAGANDTGVNIL